MRSSIRKLAKFVLTAILLGLLVRIVGVQEISRAFDGIIWHWAIAMVIAGLLMKVVTSVQLWAVFRRAQLSVSVTRVFLANALSALYSLALPGDIAASGVRWLDLSAATGKKAAVFNALVYHRIVTALFTLTLGVFALVVSNPLGHRAIQYGAVFLLVGLILLFVFLYHPRVGARVESALRSASDKLPRLGASYAIPVIDAMRRFHGFTIRDHTTVFAWSSVFIAFRILTYWCAIRAFDLDVNLIDILWIVAFLSVAAALPLTIANLGVREGILVLVLSPFGIASGTAVALGLVLFANHFLLALIGALYQFALSLGWLRCREGPEQGIPQVIHVQTP
jgi:uncharacterized membrane protein YbhN (UPF0104 family)